MPTFKIAGRGPWAHADAVLPFDPFRPSVLKGASMGRLGTAPSITNISPLSTGRMSVTPIWIPAQELITNLHVLTGTTAEAAGTHAWLALYQQDLTFLAQTTDDTGAAAWAANTLVQEALTATFRTKYSGVYLIGAMVAAGTVPSLLGYQTSTQAIGSGTNTGPSLNGTSTTGLAGVAPSPAGAITVQNNVFYCGWS